jgi:hypothetical protein
VYINLPEDSSSMAVVRFEIDGSWPVQDFCEMLATIEDVYDRVARTMMIGDLVVEERRQFGKGNATETDEYTPSSLQWNNSYYGLTNYSGGPFGDPPTLSVPPLHFQVAC